MKMIETLKKAVAGARGLECELVAFSSTRGLTRFANSEVHQNVVESERDVTARVARGRSVGVATTNALDGKSLERVIEDAAEIAKNVPPNPDFAGLPKPARVSKLKLHDPAVERMGPSTRVDALGRVFKSADKFGFTVAGAYQAASGEIAIASSAGVAVDAKYTSNYVNMTAMHDESGGSGYVACVGRTAKSVDVPALGEIAIRKCWWAREPRELPAGVYDVILEPAAVAEALEWLSYVGMGSRSFIDGTSFLNDRIGQKVAHESFTLLDDPYDPAGVAFPFDFEGMPKKRTPIIENGIARGVVHSSHTAAKLGVPNTGHAVPGDSGSQGGYPLNMAIEPGAVPRAEMLAALGTGLLVTRFHYVNGLIDTRNAVLTGMTRDGTYWVEGGKVKHGVKNLRFTEKMLSAFSRMDGVSRERVAIPAWWGDAGAAVVPSLLIRKFTFTGTSDH